MTDHPALRGYRERIENVLDQILTDDDRPAGRLLDAMRYSALGGGKRLRPCLVYATGEALGAPLSALDAPAAAVELIHVYSLIHDDLPAMDDDDLRRGRPSCHRAFDEAIAILAGDALQALAFSVLARSATAGMIRLLADRIGTRGMAGGQAIDLAAVGQRIAPDLLEEMHRRKTGALIEASVLLGAATAGVTEGSVWDGLRRYGRDLGLAFQIQDDILDVEGQAEHLGKAAGADARLQKPTWPSVHGLDQARAQAESLQRQAMAALTATSFTGDQIQQLQSIAAFVIERRH